jgi:Protein of unknown function (DUF2892)
VQLICVKSAPAQGDNHARRTRCCEKVRLDGSNCAGFPQARDVPNQIEEPAMTNVGTIDRALRFIAGLILIALSFLPAGAPAFAGLGVWHWVLAAVGIVMLGTAVLRFCPAYSLFGMNTCARR